MEVENFKMLKIEYPNGKLKRDITSHTCKVLTILKLVKDNRIKHHNAIKQYNATQCDEIQHKTNQRQTSSYKHQKQNCNSSPTFSLSHKRP